MFKSIRALAIYVTDLDQAKRFYTEILGFSLSVDLGSNLCFLKSKLNDINVYLEGGKKPTSIDNQTCRLSFFLQAERNASERYNSLKAAGVKILQDAPELVGDETACFQFEDPDGNIIEVCGKP
jgi:predicted enzyme related to lactoylglutathione lyase